jgi:hypothetical protein
MVANNPPDSPYFPTADDYGCFGWTLDPEDILTAAATLVTQKLLLAMVVIPNTVTVNRISCAFANTTSLAVNNFNGAALYSANSGFTTLTQVAASATQAWSGSTSTTALTDIPLTAATQITPGYYWAGFLTSFTAGAPTLHGATAVSAAAINFTKNSAVATAYRAAVVTATQTTMPATVSIAGITASAFTPFLAVS